MLLSVIHFNEEHHAVKLFNTALFCIGSSANSSKAVDPDKSSERKPEGSGFGASLQLRMGRTATQDEEIELNPLASLLGYGYAFFRWPVATLPVSRVKLSGAASPYSLLYISALHWCGQDLLCMFRTQQLLSTAGEEGSGINPS
jgi:hypothetical protein